MSITGLCIQLGVVLLLCVPMRSASRLIEESQGRWGLKSMSQHPMESQASLSALPSLGQKLERNRMDRLNTGIHFQETESN